MRAPPDAERPPEKGDLTKTTDLDIGSPDGSRGDGRDSTCACQHDMDLWACRDRPRFEHDPEGRTCRLPDVCPTCGAEPSFKFWTPFPGIWRHAMDGRGPWAWCSGCDRPWLRWRTGAGWRGAEEVA